MGGPSASRALSCSLPLRPARLALLLAVASVLAARWAEAKQVPVASVVDLQNAVAAAMPGDEIILSPGPYAVSTIDCTANGTMSQPIVVRGAMPLTSQVKGTTGEAFRVSGAYWTFEDLDVEGGCGQDSTCVTAFHVVGAADGFSLLRSRVRDFDRSIAVDVAQVAGQWRAPDGGLLLGNEIADTHARNTTNPVVKVDLAAGSGWSVRANYIHDFRRVDGVRTYGAVMRGGGSGDVFDRNLVLCTHDWTAKNGSLAVGLSVGGDGTPPAACGPAYDADAGVCAVEHTGGILRNDIVVACSDVGVLVSRGADVHVLFDTVIDTPGVDLDQATTTGEAHGNVLTNLVRPLNGAVIDATGNLDSVTPNQFLLMYRSPLDGDLRAASAGSVDMLIGKAPTVASVTDDYCARPRAAPYDLGALQASLGDCVTVPPPLTVADGGADAGDDASDDGGGSGDASMMRDGSGEDAGDGGGSSGGKGGGCACTAGTGGAATAPIGAMASMLLLVLVRRRRRSIV
jgi:MYXO-CTERM domain-containing protein